MSRKPDAVHQQGLTFTTAKADKLQEYIKEQNEKGNKFFGGIVIKKKEGWKINQKENYKWDAC